jgi:predicted dehydrogenase
MTPTRRQFVRSAAATTAALSAPFILGAEQTRQRKFKTALIGSGWWGKNILREAIASKRCDITSLCDVDGRILEQAQDQVNDLTGSSPKIFKDFRELLEKDKPDIAIIATPDHWHALQSIAALKAGAHVYVEKPTGHTINESRAVVKTARETGKVVQVGLHRRVGPHYVSARNFFLAGNVGELGMARCFVDSGGGKENPADNSDPAEELDWDLWCGPGPLRPFNGKLHPGGWRNFLDYANGQLGDWGVHWLDQVQWFTGVKYPKRIFSSAGRPVRGTPINDGKRMTTDAPDHQVVVYDFEQFTCTWEHRQFAGNATEKHRLGVYFYGTKGILHVGWQDGWTFYPTAGNKTIHEDSQIQQPDGHNIKLLWADFLDAIDQNRRPAADIEPAHRATAMALLGMLSWKVERSVNWDAEKEQIVGDSQANATLARAYRKPWLYPSI